MLFIAFRSIITMRDDDDDSDRRGTYYMAGMVPTIIGSYCCRITATTPTSIPKITNKATASIDSSQRKIQASMNTI